MSALRQYKRNEGYLGVADFVKLVIKVYDRGHGDGAPFSIFMARRHVLSGGGQPMFPLVINPNIRTNTHRSHDRSFRPIGQCCVRRIVLVCSSRVAALYSVSRNIPPPPPTLKSRDFLPLFKNQDKTGIWGAFKIRFSLGVVYVKSRSLYR